MIITNMMYKNREILRQQIRLFTVYVEERCKNELEFINSIYILFDSQIEKCNSTKKKEDLILQKSRYLQKTVDYRIINDFYNEQIHTICNHLEKMNEYDLELIHDVLIYPIRIKEVVKKYDLKSESQVYREVDKILNKTIEKR